MDSRGRGRRLSENMKDELIDTENTSVCLVEGAGGERRRA